MTFPKGQSGNPGGRSKVRRRREHELSEAIAELAGPRFKKYLERLDEIAMTGENRDSIRAIEILIERRFGRSPEVIHIEGEAAPEVNWSAVPLDRRRQLLDALAELDAYTAGSDGSTEH